MEEQAADEQPSVEHMNKTDLTRVKNREVLAEMLCPGLAEWAQRLAAHGANLVDAAELSVRDGEHAVRQRTWRIRLFTRTHQYTITARPPYGMGGSISTHADAGYLGCTVTARQPLAGEDWTRGRDLPDGPYCEETWNEIVHGILGYELVRLGK